MLAASCKQTTAEPLHLIVGAKCTRTHRETQTQLEITHMHDTYNEKVGHFRTTRYI